MSENYSNSSKVLASLSYASWGIVGFILLILRKTEDHFLRFHVYQSLFLGIIFVLLKLASAELLSLLGVLLFFSKTLQTNFMLISGWFLQILNLAQIGLLLYCVITLWRNKYTWIKWISNQVYKMI